MPIQFHNRLEEIIGKPLGDFTWDDLQRTVDGRIQEDQELEFKSQHYGLGESDKQECAKDIAAFANTTGGVMIIGIDEDNQGCASGLNPVSLEEVQVRRYHEIVASRMKPLITFSSVNIDMPGADGMGAVVLVIERSGFAPHAAIVNDGLRYPRRHGRTINYLGENEVALAYRERMMLAQSRIELLKVREEEFLENLDPSERWLVMTLVPDFPGSVPLNKSTFEEFQSQFAGKRAAVPWYAVTLDQVRVRHRRIYASDRDLNDVGRNRWCGLELHTDGSGCYGIRLGLISPTNTSTPRDDLTSIVSDGALANCIISGLEKLGQHAWSSSAQGLANVRCQIWPVQSSAPIALGTQHSFLSTWVGETFGSLHPCDVSVPVDEIGRVGKDLIASAAALLQEMSQSLGIIDSGYLDVDGRVHIQSWEAGSRDSVRQWFVSHNIEVVET